MTREQRIRLSNRIETCKNEYELACRRFKADLKDKMFWRHELMAAEAEFHGFKQGELALSNCKGCGE